MKGANLIYCPLKEEDRGIPGWDKETIKYTIEKEKVVKNIIRSVAKSRMGKSIQQADVDDIYSNVLYYFYCCDDYNIDKALNRSSSESIVSIDGYINKCIKFCVLRYVTDMMYENNTVKGDIVVDRDGNETSLFDHIESDEKVECTTDLNTLCRTYESDRYTYGADMYLIWFIKLVSMKYNKTEEQVNCVLDAIGITKKNLRCCDIDNSEGPIFEMAKAITICGIEDAIEVFRKFTYSAHNIEAAIINS